MKEDLELHRYRDLMAVPTSWTDGFTLKSVIGCIFIGLVMMPASMYLGLLVGGDLGSAAQWVTVILFVELARRSFTQLKSPEIAILFYMTGAAISSPFSGFLWTQFYVQSDPAKALGIAEHIPYWIAPAQDVLDQRNFFVRAWAAPILLMIGQQILGRIDQFGLGYVLFRLTSDVERLPFPMSPVSAMGITALAESSSGEQTWKWRVFSFGGMIGMLYAFIYVGVPAITGVFLKSPIQIIPIPFVDLTTNTETFLKAVPVALSLDVGNLLVGMVIPFYAVIGSFLGLVITWIANPLLLRAGVLHSWRPGMNALDTDISNYLDAYLSIGIGIALSIALIGFFHVFASLRRKRSTVAVVPEAIPVSGSSSPPAAAAPAADETDRTSGWYRLTHPPAGRGDFPLWVGLAIYLFSTTCYVTASKFLVPQFPLWVLLGYGFIYTPVISYVAARMEGVVGQWVDIPMVREATFILAHKFGGYQGVGIWFAPIPINNYAGSVLSFRTTELTGTKFTSLIKAELCITPVVLVSSLIFAQYLWHASPIPSPVYPYTTVYWENNARRLAIIHSSTISDYSQFYGALKGWWIAGAAGVGTLVYTVLAGVGAPVMLCFGLVRGLGTALNAGLIPQTIGALLGRFYFEKRFGLKWREYTPVLLAGYACGTGLVSMLSLGVTMIGKAVFQLPY